MAKHKSINDILWNVDEQTYREDPSYHYSLLSDFRSVGIHKAAELFDKTETKKPSKSLIFGSLVDAMLTDPDKLSLFQNVGSAKDAIKLTPTEKRVAEFILSYKDVYSLDNVINDSELFYNAFVCCDAYSTSTKDKILEKHGAAIIEYVKQALSSASDKMQITEEDYVDAAECKEAIMTSKMREYFEAMPFDDDVERVFQAKIKWRDERTNISYRIMLDNLYVNHTKKIIIPNDLKTSSDYEDEFYRNFIKWNYDIQARLYWRGLYKLIMNDDYFKQFKVLPFQFLVVSRYSKTPLIWRYDDCCKSGQLVYLKKDNTKIILEDPYVLGKLLRDCEEHKNLIRPGLTSMGSNSLEHWIENGD